MENLEQNINGETESTDLALGISYTRNLTLYVNRNNETVKVNNWQEILNNPEYISSQYTTLATIKTYVL